MKALGDGAIKASKTTRNVLAIAFSLGLASALYPLASSAGTLTVTPSGHATDETVGSVRTIYFPLKGSGSCATQRVFPTTLSPIDGSSATAILNFQVTATTSLTTINGGAAPGANDISVEVSAVGDYANQVVLDDINSGYNDASNRQVKYGTANAIPRSFGIKLAGANGFCSIYGADANCRSGLTSTPPKKYIRMGVVTTAGGLSANSGSPTYDYADFYIALVDCPIHNTAGTFAIPSLNLGIVPGDERVKLVNDSTAPTGSGDSIGLKSVIVYGAKNSVTPTLDNAEVKAEFPGTGGIYTIGNLGNDTRYCFGLGYLNKGGMVSTDSSWSTSFAGFDSSKHCATPSRIDGFLERSTCFIATAAYGDEWDPRLEVLRQFRDQILEQFDSGRTFTKWYYSWSPDAAKWLIENPGYRRMIKLALLPVVESARFALWLRGNMWALGVVFVLGTVSLIFRNLKTESEA